MPFPSDGLFDAVLPVGPLVALKESLGKVIHQADATATCCKYLHIHINLKLLNTPGRRDSEAYLNDTVRYYSVL